MKLLFVILILIGIISCYVEKRIQVKVIILRVKSSDPAYRADRGEYFHIVWIDDDGAEYDQYCTCPQYKPGYTEKFLITR